MHLTWAKAVASPSDAPGHDGRLFVHVRVPPGQKAGGSTPTQLVQEPPPRAQSPKNSQLENPVTVVMTQLSP
jgi:hypothetical protein